METENLVTSNGAVRGTIQINPVWSIVLQTTVYY
jgi:hypothetical protein